MGEELFIVKMLYVKVEMSVEIAWALNHHTLFLHSYWTHKKLFLHAVSSAQAFPHISQIEFGM